MPPQLTPTKPPKAIFPTKQVQPALRIPIAQVDPQEVLPILKTQEDSVKQQVPSMFSDAVNKIPSPTKAYKDYSVTGNPVFKQAAGNALSALQGFATKAKVMLSTPASQPPSILAAKTEQVATDSPLLYSRQKAEDWSVPVTVPNKYKDNVFTTAQTMKVDPKVLGTILNKESQGNPLAVNHNKDGTIDQGLMQINSTNLPAVQKYFKQTGRHFDPFNPSDSIEAAAFLLKNNEEELTDKLGRQPTSKEVYDSYNLGVGGFMKAIQGNKDEKELLQKYDLGGIFSS